MAKNLKLPNSYGSVTKMSNASRRRKPYMVRITTGYALDEAKGKSIQKYAIIGYAKTRQEGMQMLAKYHERPFDSCNTTLGLTKKSIIDFHFLSTFFAGSLCLIHIYTVNQFNQHRTV